MKSKDLTGKKFNHLTIIKKDLSNFNSKIKYICQCSCGKIKSIFRSNIVQGTTKSCGHLLENKYKNMKKSKGARGFYLVKIAYKNGAKYRNIKFHLTDEELLKLFKGNCYWCGIEPKQIKIDNSQSLLSETKENGKFIYNGIDRLDNDIGYISSNVVSCCKYCNLAKRSQTLVEFENWINRLTEYRANKK